ncbi:hypothetical protein BH09MYX1_BH09MYX1_13360 [soil metagenome]
MAGRTVTEKFEYSGGDRIVGRRGQYRVKSQLGAGGMGACYLVDDTDAPRSYVLKTIHSSLLDNASAVEAFDLEGRGLIALHACPQIVQAFHIDAMPSGAPFYLMEVLAGRSLRAALTGMEGRRMRLDPDTACGVGLGIANALVFAHGKAVVHCDLKPEDVFLVQTPQGNGVKLLDFGVMKGMLIRAGYQGAGGTPAYMAPEQLRREDIDARADLFAFGVLLYEMIAGRHPFQNFGMGLKGAVARIDLLPPPLASLRLGLQDEVARFLDDLIGKLVEPKMAKRCDDASYILVKLTEAKRLIASRIGKRNLHAATTNPGAPTAELMAHVTGAVDEATVAPGTDPDLDIHRVDADAVALGSTLPSPRDVPASPELAELPSTIPPSSSLPEATRGGVTYVEKAPESHKEIQRHLALAERLVEKKRVPIKRAADTVVEPPDYHANIRKDARPEYGTLDTLRRKLRRWRFRTFGNRSFSDPIMYFLLLAFVGACAYGIYRMVQRPTNSAAPAPAVSQTSQAR